MVQFLKSSKTGELVAVENLKPHFQIFRFEKTRGFFWNLNDEEKVELKKEIQDAYVFVCETLQKEACDILILDEILGALKNRLIEEKQLLHLIDIKPEKMELIMTGRNAPEALIERADLVTEMKDIKHYMNEGVNARKGIEF